MLRSSFSFASTKLIVKEELCLFLFLFLSQSCLYFFFYVLLVFVCVCVYLFYYYIFLSSSSLISFVMCLLFLLPRSLCVFLCGYCCIFFLTLFAYVLYILFPVLWPSVPYLSCFTGGHYHHPNCLRAKFMNSASIYKHRDSCLWASRHSIFNVVFLVQEARGWRWSGFIVRGGCGA